MAPRRLLALSILAIAFSASSICSGAESGKSYEFPFKNGDRVAWIGSSSTCIGQYCQTLEFLLRTQHPEIKLTCRRFSNIYKDTFEKCTKTLPGWLQEFKPTLVFFQYGGNDSEFGEAGLPAFKTNIEKCMAMVKDAHARVFLVTPQAVDARMFGADKTQSFYLYADKLIEMGKENNWPVIDTHNPLIELLERGRKDDPTYTITHDKTHMTLPAYIAWGYYQYALLTPPQQRSAAELSADGKVISTERCAISGVAHTTSGLTFTRADEVLPILPSGPLPPRAYVPLEKYTEYALKVTGLPPGEYELLCEGKLIGAAEAKTLEKGVNLNSVLLDSNNPAPWQVLAKEVWDASKKLFGKGPTGGDPVFEKIGKTQWKFEVRRK